MKFKYEIIERRNEKLEEILKRESRTYNSYDISNYCIYVIVKLNKKIMGFSKLLNIIPKEKIEKKILEKLPNEDFAYTQMLFVEPKYRNKGLGKELLNKTIDNFKTNKNFTSNYILRTIRETNGLFQSGYYDKLQDLIKIGRTSKIVNNEEYYYVHYLQKK